MRRCIWRAAFSEAVKVPPSPAMHSCMLWLQCSHYTNATAAADSLTIKLLHNSELVWLEHSYEWQQHCPCHPLCPVVLVLRHGNLTLRPAGKTRRFPNTPLSSLQRTSKPLPACHGLGLKTSTQYTTRSFLSVFIWINIQMNTNAQTNRIIKKAADFIVESHKTPGKKT